MSGHTPGPWVFLEEGTSEDGSNASMPLTICGPAHDDLANVYSSADATVNVSRAEAIANARLIAAAPDLLAALKTLVPSHFDEHPQDFTLDWHWARAAIVKAEGLS